MKDFENPKFSVKDSKDNLYEMELNLPDLSTKRKENDFSSINLTSEDDGDLDIQIVYADFDKDGDDFNIFMDLDLSTIQAESVFYNPENTELMKDLLNRVYLNYDLNFKNIKLLHYRVSFRKVGSSDDELEARALEIFKNYFPKIKTDDIALDAKDELLETEGELILRHYSMEVRR